MNFGKFNKKQLFTNLPEGVDEYISLEELYKENGPEAKYCIRAFYINTRSDFAPETPVVLTNDYYVNIPLHQLSEVKDIMTDNFAVKAINNKEAGFTIESYYKEKYGKTCYKAVWCNYNEADEDFDSDEVIV